MTTMFLMMSSSTARSLASALDSAFFKSRRRKPTDLTGHRPEHVSPALMPVSHVHNHRPAPVFHTFNHNPRFSQCLAMDCAGAELTLGGAELLGLRGPANAAREPPERNNLLVLLDVAEVRVRLLQGHACFCSARIQCSLALGRLTRDGSGNLSHVLEVCPNILSPRLSDCTIVSILLTPTPLCGIPNGQRAPPISALSTVHLLAPKAVPCFSNLALLSFSLAAGTA